MSDEKRTKLKRLPVPRKIAVAKQPPIGVGVTKMTAATILPFLRHGPTQVKRSLEKRYGLGKVCGRFRTYESP
jgi:hypothetical protein